VKRLYGIRVLPALAVRQALRALRARRARKA
jgi:hypothetical protein